MITPLLGIATITGVLTVAFTNRSGGTIGFLDIHAMFVVFGGVLGALLIAVDLGSLKRMAVSARELLPSTSMFSKELKATRDGLEEIKVAWRAGQRSKILAIADSGQTEELRAMANMMLRQANKNELREGFSQLRASYMHKVFPVIEGWELVSKLAPSFGMVGTVAGMVQLFKNMGQSSDLGGAMAMALLATLYGIGTGAAIGGPMASRVNKQFNDRMSMLDLLERTLISLLADEAAVKENKR